MTDEELLDRLRELAMSLGPDARWLIYELIKRYRLAKFEASNPGRGANI